MSYPLLSAQHRAEKEKNSLTLNKWKQFLKEANAYYTSKVETAGNFVRDPVVHPSLVRWSMSVYWVPASVLGTGDMSCKKMTQYLLSRTSAMEEIIASATDGRLSRLAGAGAGAAQGFCASEPGGGVQSQVEAAGGHRATRRAESRARLGTCRL